MDEQFTPAQGKIRRLYSFFQPIPNYKVVISWSEADQTFRTDVPDLPGCVAKGPERDIAVNQAEQEIREWIATARELGRAVPKPTE